MDSPPSKESEVVNEKGELETKVDTVDYQTLPGQGQQKKRDVQVIHETRPSRNSATAAGSVVASAAAAAGVAIQATRDAMSGK